jgi:hypothetical protein
VHGLVATAIAASATAPQLILDNESAKPATIVLRDTATVQVETLSAALAGLQTAQLSPTQGRVKLTLAGDSVAAVLPPQSSPPAAAADDR